MKYKIGLSLFIFLIGVVVLVPSHSYSAAKRKHKSLSAKQIKALEIKILKSNDSLKYRLKLAKHFERERNQKKVIEYLSPVSDGLGREATHLLAQAYHKEKDYLAEIRVLEAWVGKNEKDYLSLKDMGDAYLAIDKKNLAIRGYQLAIAANKKYKPAYDSLLKLLERNDAFYDSRVLVGDMIAEFGEKPEFLHKLCELFFVDGFLKDARSNCQRAVVLDPSYPDSHVILALSFKELGDQAAYKKILLGAAKQFSGSELAQFQAGQLSEETKNLNSAYRYYHQATIAKPKSHRSWLQVGEVGVKIKKYKEALSAYKKACLLDRTKTMESFRRSQAELRIAGVNNWKRKFDTGIQKCKYEGKYEKDLTVKDLDRRVRDREWEEAVKQQNPTATATAQKPTDPKTPIASKPENKEPSSTDDEVDTED